MRLIWRRLLLSSFGFHADYDDCHDDHDNHDHDFDDNHDDEC